MFVASYWPLPNMAWSHVYTCVVLDYSRGVLILYSAAGREGTAALCTPYRSSFSLASQWC